MKYQTKTIEQHTATFANGVTVTRENMADLLHTLNVQIENTQVSIRCTKAHLDEQSELLLKLEQDKQELLELSK